jgi:hypothetical protein
MSQPEAVDINEILFRPTRQEINLTVVYMPDKRGMSVLELGCRSATEPTIRKGFERSPPEFPGFPPFLIRGKFGPISV